MSRSRRSSPVTPESMGRELPLDAMLKAAAVQLHNAHTKESAQTMERVAGKDYTIVPFGGNNNLNFLVTHKKSGAGLVLQYTSTNDELERGLRSLGKVAEIAQPYNSAFIEVTHTGNKQLVALRAVEKCASPVAVRAETIRDHGDDPYEFAMQAAGSVSGLLKKLSKNDMIWTDMKAGNLLVRANGEIVVADTKAMIQSDQIGRKAGKADFKDLSGAYLSRAFVNKLESGGIDYKDRKSAFEKEYSYQLGVILYSIVTGHEKKTSDVPNNKGNKKDWDEKFNFSGDYFKTPNGKKMEYVIQRLCNSNPDLRIAHDKAVQLLASSAELNKEMAAQPLAPKQPQLKSNASTTPTVLKKLAIKRGPLVDAVAKQLQSPSAPVTGPTTSTPPKPPTPPPLKPPGASKKMATKSGKTLTEQLVAKVGITPATTSGYGRKSDDTPAHLKQSRLPGPAQSKVSPVTKSSPSRRIK